MTSTGYSYIFMCIRIRLCFRLRIRLRLRLRFRLLLYGFVCCFAIRLLLCDSFAVLRFRFHLTLIPQQL